MIEYNNELIYLGYSSDYKWKGDAISEDLSCSCWYIKFNSKLYII